MNIPQPNSFDPANAKQLILAAERAYSAPERESDGGAEEIVYSALTDTLAVVSETDSDFTVAFRGTMLRVVDWVHDLDLRFSTLSFQGVKFRVHTGFYRDVISVWYDLLPKVQRAVSEGKRVWLGGHSKGGADAKLFAWLLWRRETIRVAGIYTCGEPRSMGRKARDDFETYLGDRSFRVIDSADLVPHLPLPPIFIHDGDAVFFDDGTPLDGAQSWFIFKKAVVLWVRWLLRLKLIGIYDHGVALYVKLFP